MGSSLLWFIAGVVVGYIVIPRIIPNLKATEMQILGQFQGKGGY